MKETILRSESKFKQKNLFSFTLGIYDNLNQTPKQIVERSTGFSITKSFSLEGFVSCK